MISSEKVSPCICVFHHSEHNPYSLKMLCWALLLCSPYVQLHHQKFDCPHYFLRPFCKGNGLIMPNPCHGNIV